MKLIEIWSEVSNLAWRRTGAKSLHAKSHAAKMYPTVVILFINSTYWEQSVVQQG